MFYCAVGRDRDHRPFRQSCAAPARWSSSLDGVVPALVACGHVHQYRNTEAAGTRHVWGTSTAFVLPDRLQPRYGTKEVGYVEHRLGRRRTP